MFNWQGLATKSGPWLCSEPAAASADAPAAPRPLCDWIAPALDTAGLGSLVSHGDGLTLLAPSDAALDQWLQRESLDRAGLLADPDRLRRLLLPHVLPQHLSSAALRQSRALSGLSPALTAVQAGPAGPLLLDGRQRSARLIAGDLRLGRLHIHLIDRVLEAPAQHLLGLVQQRHEFSDLAEALERSGLSCVLRSQGPFTLFAPSNDGLALLAARLGLRRRSLLANSALLADVLRHHLVSGRFASNELPWGGRLNTLRGTVLLFSPLGLIGEGGDAQPLQQTGELPASNGVLHRLSQALLPPPA
jgi:uncharacterized surface protein with fasciclin (FAS1) repeats